MINILYVGLGGFCGAVLRYLGGFTTFSTFGHEIFNLFQEGHVAAALRNVAIQLLLGFAAVLGRGFIGEDGLGGCGTFLNPLPTASDPPCQGELGVVRLLRFW